MGYKVNSYCVFNFINIRQSYKLYALHSYKLVEKKLPLYPSVIRFYFLNLLVTRILWKFREIILDKLKSQNEIWGFFRIVKQILLKSLVSAMDVWLKSWVNLLSVWSLLSVHQDSMVLSGTFHSYPNLKEQNRKAWGSG